MQSTTFVGTFGQRANGHGASNAAADSDRSRRIARSANFHGHIVVVLHEGIGVTRQASISRGLLPHA